MASGKGPAQRYGRLRVPPLLVIESVSEGHEDHDRKIKRQWYAQAGVANYWILDPYRRTLDCLALKNTDYMADVSGKQTDVLTPTIFTGLTVRLHDVWL